MSVSDSEFFKKQVDELCLLAHYDPELEESFRWLDEESRRRGISFYEMVLKALQRYEADVKAKEWLNTK